MGLFVWPDIKKFNCLEADFPDVGNGPLAILFGR